MTVIAFSHQTQDFSVEVIREARKAQSDLMFTVSMTLAGETISAEGIKHVMDADDFEVFTYENWVEYFHFMKEEWEM